MTTFKKRRKKLAEHLSIAWQAYERDCGFEYAGRTFKGSQDIFWTELADRLIDGHESGINDAREELIKDIDES